MLNQSIKLISLLVHRQQYNITNLTRYLEKGKHGKAMLIYMYVLTPRNKSTDDQNRKKLQNGHYYFMSRDGHVSESI